MDRAQPPHFIPKFQEEMGPIPEGQLVVTQPGRGSTEIQALASGPAALLCIAVHPSTAAERPF